MVQNNPIAMLVHAAKSGGNPMKLMENLASQDPQAAKVMKMIKGKSSSELRKMAENIAANNGTTVEEVARQLGIM